MVIDQLEVIDGYIEEDCFIMRGIAGHTMIGTYRAAGLRSMARLIDDTPMSFTIDKEKFIRVPVELNKQIKKELNMIADELEKDSL